MSSPHITRHFTSNVLQAVPDASGRFVWTLEGDGTVAYRSATDGSLRLSCSGYTAGKGPATALVAASIRAGGDTQSLTTPPLKRLYIGSRSGVVVIADTVDPMQERITQIIGVPPGVSGPVTGLLVLKSRNQGGVSMLIVAHEKSLHQCYLCHNGSEWSAATSMHLKSNIVSLYKDYSTDSRGYAALEDGSIVAFEAEGTSPLRTMTESCGNNTPAQTVLGIGDRVWCSNRIDPVVHVWDVPTGTRLSSIPNTPCHSLVLMNLEVLAIGSDGTTSCFHAATMKPTALPKPGPVGGVQGAVYIGTISTHLLWTKHADNVTRMWIHQPNVGNSHTADVQGPGYSDQIYELNEALLNYETQLNTARDAETMLRSQIHQRNELIDAQESIIKQLEQQLSNRTEEGQKRIEKALVQKDKDATHAQLEMLRNNLLQQEMALREKAEAIKLQQDLIEEMKNMTREHVEQMYDMQQEIDYLSQTTLQLKDNQSDYDRIKEMQGDQEESIQNLSEQLKEATDLCSSLHDKYAQATENEKLLIIDLDDKTKEAASFKELWDTSQQVVEELTLQLQELQVRVNVQQNLLEEKNSSIEIYREIVASKESNIQELEEQLDTMQDYLEVKMRKSDQATQYDAIVRASVAVMAQQSSVAKSITTDMSISDFIFVAKSNLRSSFIQTETQVVAQKLYRAMMSQTDEVVAAKPPLYPNQQQQQVKQGGAGSNFTSTAEQAAVLISTPMDPLDQTPVAILTDTPRKVKMRMSSTPPTRQESGDAEVAFFSEGGGYTMSNQPAVVVVQQQQPQQQQIPQQQVVVIPSIPISKAVQHQQQRVTQQTPDIFVDPPSSERGNRRLSKDSGAGGVNPTALTPPGFNPTSQQQTKQQLQHSPNIVREKEIREKEVVHVLKETVVFESSGGGSTQGIIRRSPTTGPAPALVENDGDDDVNADRVPKNRKKGSVQKKATPQEDSSDDEDRQQRRTSKKQKAPRQVEEEESENEDRIAPKRKPVASRQYSEPEEEDEPLPTRKPRVKKSSQYREEEEEESDDELHQRRRKQKNRNVEREYSDDEYVQKPRRRHRQNVEEEDDEEYVKPRSRQQSAPSVIHSSGSGEVRVIRRESPHDVFIIEGGVTTASQQQSRPRMVTRSGGGSVEGAADKYAEEEESDHNDEPKRVTKPKSQKQKHVDPAASNTHYEDDEEDVEKFVAKPKAKKFDREKLNKYRVKDDEDEFEEVEDDRRQSTGQTRSANRGNQNTRHDEDDEEIYTRSTYKQSKNPLEKDLNGEEPRRGAPARRAPTKYDEEEEEEDRRPRAPARRRPNYEDDEEAPRDKKKGGPSVVYVRSGGGDVKAPRRSPDMEDEENEQQVVYVSTGGGRTKSQRPRNDDGDGEDERDVPVRTGGGKARAQPRKIREHDEDDDDRIVYASSGGGKTKSQRPQQHEEDEEEAPTRNVIRRKPVEVDREESQVRDVKKSSGPVEGPTGSQKFALPLVKVSQGRPASDCGDSSEYATLRSAGGGHGPGGEWETITNLSHRRRPSPDHHPDVDQHHHVGGDEGEEALTQPPSATATHLNRPPKAVNIVTPRGVPSAAMDQLPTRAIKLVERINASLPSEYRAIIESLVSEIEDLTKLLQEQEIFNAHLRKTISSLESKNHLDAQMFQRERDNWSHEKEENETKLGDIQAYTEKAVADAVAARDVRIENLERALEIARDSSLTSQHLNLHMNAATGSRQEVEDLQLLLAESRQQTEIVMQTMEMIEKDAQDARAAAQKAEMALSELEQTHGQDLQRIRRLNDIEIQKITNEKQKLQSEVFVLEAELARLRTEVKLAEQNNAYREANLATAEEALQRERNHLNEIITEAQRTSRDKDEQIASLRAQLQGTQIELFKATDEVASWKRVKNEVTLVKDLKSTAIAQVHHEKNMLDAKEAELEASQQLIEDLRRRVNHLEMEIHTPLSLIVVGGDDNHQTNDLTDPEMKLLLENHEATIEHQRKDLDVLHEEVVRLNHRVGPVK